MPGLPKPPGANPPAAVDAHIAFAVETGHREPVNLVAAEQIVDDLWCIEALLPGWTSRLNQPGR